MGGRPSDTRAVSHLSGEEKFVDSRGAWTETDVCTGHISRDPLRQREPDRLSRNWRERRDVVSEDWKTKVTGEREGGGAGKQEGRWAGVGWGLGRWGGGGE